MQYVLTFLEGFISFISPCMLPMLPIYLTYFAAGDSRKGKVLSGALSFVLGFSVVFCGLGVLAGTAGAFLKAHQTAVNVVSGLIVIVFGLSYLEVIPLNFLKGLRTERKAGNILSAFVFGMVFSVNLTPCVGAFLGSALMLAAAAGGALQGLSLLAVYSLGLGVPFVVSAVLIDRLKTAFSFIKKNYRVINTVCGVFLIAVGTLMALGQFGRYLSLI